MTDKRVKTELVETYPYFKFYSNITICDFKELFTTKKQLICNDLIKELELSGPSSNFSRMNIKDLHLYQKQDNKKVAENQQLNLIYGPGWSNLEPLGARFGGITRLKNISVFQELIS